MNGARGEAVVEIAGERRVVCLTLGALAEIETGLGVDGLAGLAERMRSLSARDLMTVLEALLRGQGEDAASVDPREAARAVAAAFEAAVR